MRCRLLLSILPALSGSLPVAAASLDKSIDIAASAAVIWTRIGPFCSIKDWHPAIGQCDEADGMRTLKTRDGATFVEKESARDDKAMTYSYEIESSPLPVTKYSSTLKVTPKGENRSTVEWLSTYTPAPGKDTDAATAIGNIYQAGLDNIRNLTK